jgi:hypothetical protein
MSFVLRWGPREIDLPLGRFLIGRAESAQLALDDPLVSRHHAAIDVTGTAATLTDLDSRNGVRVNGVKLTQAYALAVGDKISIGTTDLLFALSGGDLAAQTLVQAPTMRMQAFGLFGMLADKALAMGRGDEAERLLGPQIEQLLADAARGKKVDASTVERASLYALRLAQVTGKPAWMDAVFRFYRAAGRLCPSSIVDELYAVARKVKQPEPGELRQYLAVLRELSRDFGPAERFLLGRLEGLERSLG